MTAVFAVLLVLGAVVLCAVAWHTRHPGAPGVPDRENGALPAWDPAELQEWNVERKKTKSTPPWPPLPHPDAAAGSQGGGHDWLAAPTPASLSPAAGMVAGENPARLSMGHETPAAGDPVTHDLWQPRPADEWTTEEAHADEPRDLRRAPGTRSRADAGMRAVPPGVQRVHEEVAGGEERVEDGETGRPVAVPGIGPGLAAHGDPVAELTGAAERIRALSLDEYEAAFPGWEHGTGWFRAIDGGEVAR